MEDRIFSISFVCVCVAAILKMPQERECIPKFSCEHYRFLFYRL